MSDPIPVDALLAGYPPARRATAERIRAIVAKAVPDAIERVRPGWRVIGYDVPLGRRTAFFAWLMAQREHVHLGFPQGVILDDPEHILEGAGITKRARWLTAINIGDIELVRYQAFARQAADLARMSKWERFARLHEQEARDQMGWP